MRRLATAIVLVLVGVTPFVRSKPSAATDKEAPAKSATAESDTGKSAKTKKSKEAEVDAQPLTQEELASHPYKIIATVPDPKLTGLGLDFDRWIDSLQSAAAVSGFDFKRQWIPWLSSAKDRKKAGLLFFGGNEHGRSLVIYLVAESPESGINKEQMRDALGQEPKKDLIGVIGPSFSGGFPSEFGALEKQRKTTPMITGSATGDMGSGALYLGALLGRTVDTDKSAESAFCAYLEARHIEFHAFTGMNETATAYGDEEDIHPKASVEGFVRFPRNISALRAEYEANQLLGKSLEKGSPGLKPDDPLKLPEDDLKDGPETVPTQSGASTVAADLEMQQLARRLAEGRFNIASLRATNPLDIIFLRQYVAANDSDLQFYLLEPDILFIHRPQVNAFRGTLSVSRYTPVAADGKESSLFASKSAEGVYWAARSVISHTCRPANPLLLSIIGIDRYWPVARLRTSDEICTGEPCAYDNMSEAKTEWPVRPTYSYVALWLTVFAALLFVNVALIWGNWFSPARADAGPRKWLADFHFDPKAPLLFARRYHAYCLVLGLAAILLLLSRPLTEVWNSWIYLAALPALAGLCIAWPVRASQPAKRLPYLLFDEATNDSDRRLTPVMTIVVTVAVVAMVWFLAARVWNDGEHGWAYFAAYRSTYLGNGVNPILPLLLSGLSIVFCAWHQFQRTIFASERFVPLNLALLGTLQGPYERVRNILARYATRPAVFVSLLAGGLVVVLNQSYGSALSIEGSDYDNAMIALLTVSVIFAMLSACQFLQTWWHFNDFLNALQELPVRHVFDKLPRELGSGALFSVAPRVRSYLFLIRARDCLRAVPGFPAGLLQGVEKSVKRLQVRAGADQRETSEDAAAAQTSFLKASCYLLSQLQKEVWRQGESELTDPKDKPANGNIAEEFIALRFLSFIRYATLQLRNLLTYLSVSFILQAMAVSSYPFFSRSLGKMFILIAFAVLTCTTGYVLWGMSRNATLRSLATDPKGSDYPIALQSLQTACLPLLAFASTYFPDLGNVVGGWISTLSELGK